MSEPLAVFCARIKREIFAELSDRKPPSQGSFDEALWAEANEKGAPQMGSTVFHPHKIVIEFLYHDPLASAIVFPVTITPPERVVFMPVPDWVIQTIWQGEVAGSFRFESEAQKMLESFQNLLSIDENIRLFEKPLPTTRE
ncbi:MAG: hypothetical protein KDC26_06660 [Armatimonadetes bacterium]|nr:hypothetical protein [Armatimonadota bacterium]